MEVALRVLLAIAVIVWGLAIRKNFRRLPAEGPTWRFRRLADVGFGMVGAGLICLAVTFWPGPPLEGVERFAAHVSALLLAAAPLIKDKLLAAKPLVLGTLVLITTLSLLMIVPINWK
ncbi:hypothetical protein ACQQ2N_17460 [Dokdonella sp. MW10]|uniref:hypothetical protein n=1 Tax=Dokdonella sp. MW10 TaxID=2992926 RepID=UPI003F81E92F